LYSSPQCYWDYHIKENAMGETGNTPWGRWQMIPCKVLVATREGKRLFGIPRRR
jgi:hypothetical protein